MILSHAHRYIFLHCRKTAGSSICVSLARTLGPEDVMLSSLSEALAEGIALPQRMVSEAQAELAEHGTLRQKSRVLGLRGKQKRDITVKKLVLQRYRRLWNERQPQHAYAETIASAFPEEWTAFPKLCVVRNPWTKMVSDYFWRTREMPTRPDFASFVRAIETGDDLGGHIHLRYSDNWPLYSIDNQIVADHVIRFENLVPGLTSALAACGVDFDGWLPRAKGGHRPSKGNKADPMSFYTPELRDSVGRLFEREITAFGYRFESALSA